jgi:hypothetical protein
MATEPVETDGSPEIAFYYPGPIWYSPDRIKSLLLFFDGVALLVPAYMKERPEQIDPIMASPLREQGLLHILEPETLIDKPATEQLASAMTNIITSGALGPPRERGDCISRAVLLAPRFLWGPWAGAHDPRRAKGSWARA